jgi:hypothetical protein
MPVGFTPIPDWFSSENQGADVAVADVTGSGMPDLVVLTVDKGAQGNRGIYRLGRDLDQAGNVSGGWTPWTDVPDWFSQDNQGVGVAVADVNGNGRLDLVVFMIDNPAQVNRGVYRVGFDLDHQGIVTGGWTPWIDVPFWFSWENQGAAIAVADLNGNGRPDLVVFTADNPPGLNRGIYQVGHDLDGTGTAVDGWSGWQDVPHWFSWENQGAGVALADVTANGRLDLIAFLIDDPPGQNQAAYRIGFDINAEGLPALAANPPPGSGPNGPQGDPGWSSYLGVPNWFSWENQGGGIAVAQLGGEPHLVVVMVDNPPGLNAGYYRVLPLVERPERDGRWDVEPFDSEVLAVHAAVLRTGKVLFFSGSGNNPTRAASPDLGDIAKGLYTSVLWDPAARPPNNFAHPPTFRGADGRPFDFFCGGDTVLPDGSLLSAGGNQLYPPNAFGGNTGRSDCCSFDPGTERWSRRAAMAHGRWYPTLLALQDGRVLAVSGRDERNTLNTGLEVYDPVADAWRPLQPPHDPGFVGLPLYAHCFLLADGRVLFDGGRMDDPSPQGPGILDLGHDPVTFTPVHGLADPATRNQSSSVLLPPAQAQRVMIIAGGPEDATNATGDTAIVDMTAADPSFRPAQPLSLPRMHLNAVLLPDRTLFVSGGALQRENHVLARLQSEIYDPSTDTWRIAATASVVRMYHSVALLLPDGRVLTASGNPPPYGHTVQWVESQLEELKIEMYSPPYLFAGARPTVRPSRCRRLPRRTSAGRI